MAAGNRVSDSSSAVEASRYLPVASKLLILSRLNGSFQPSALISSSTIRKHSS